MARRIAVVFVCTMLVATYFTSTAVAENHFEKLNKKFKTHRYYNDTIEDIADLGDAAVIDLLSIINKSSDTKDASSRKHDWMVKVTAMNLLGELKSPAALMPLKEMLSESDNISAIYNSARTIGNIGGRLAFQILRKTLAKSNSANCTYPVVRKKAAILGLGLCVDTRAIPLLKAELNNINNNEQTRIYAAGALGMLGVKDGYDIALASIDSTDGIIKSSAITSLGMIGDPAALESLNRIDQGDTLIVPRRAARVAIAMIESKRLTGDDKVNFLKKKLKKNPRMTEMIRWGTAKLKRINSKSSRNALNDLASDAPEHSSLRHAASLKFKTMK